MHVIKGYPLYNRCLEICDYLFKVSRTLCSDMPKCTFLVRPLYFPISLQYCAMQLLSVFVMEGHIWYILVLNCLWGKVNGRICPFLIKHYVFAVHFSLVRACHVKLLLVRLVFDSWCACMWCMRVCGCISLTGWLPICTMLPREVHYKEYEIMVCMPFVVLSVLST